MPQLTDSKDIPYVEKLSKGSRDAYVFLFNKYAGKVYNTSKKMGLSHEQSEDIVQMVFLKIWNKKEDLDPSLSFNAYLLTVARSVVIKTLRKKALEVAYINYELDYVSLKSSSPEQDLLFKDLMTVSSECLNELPEKQKQVFVMKNIEHKTSDQIAKELNLSTRTIENQIYRATKNLKARLSKLDIISMLIFLLIP